MPKQVWAQIVDNFIIYDPSVGFYIPVWQFKDIPNIVGFHCLYTYEAALDLAPALDLELVGGARSRAGARSSTGARSSSVLDLVTSLHNLIYNKSTVVRFVK